MFVETKEAGEVAEAPAKVLKFSEAMRIGAKLLPPVKNLSRYFDSCGACACAAAYYAATGNMAPDMSGEIYGYWAERGLPASIFSQSSWKFQSGISREAVADWVEEQGY